MKSSTWLVFVLAISIAAPLSADVIEMPEPEVISPDATDSPAPEATTQPQFVTLPGRGMLKDQVEERFGSPIDKVPAVGEPPISSWVYNGFTVYFEYEHVIHAVNHR